MQFLPVVATFFCGAGVLFVPAYVVGLLIFASWPLTYLILIFLLLVITFLPELMLWLSRARPLPGSHRLWERTGFLEFKYKRSKVLLFSSDLLSANIYLIKGLWSSRSYILLGENSEQLADSVLDEVMKRSNWGGSAMGNLGRELGTLSLIPFYWFMAQKIFWPLKFVVVYFFLPIIWLQKNWPGIKGKIPLSGRQNVKELREKFKFQDLFTSAAYFESGEGPIDLLSRECSSSAKA